jgi:hypothetical protein
MIHSRRRFISLAAGAGLVRCRPIGIGHKAYSVIGPLTHSWSASPPWGAFDIVARLVAQWLGSPPPPEQLQQPFIVAIIAGLQARQHHPQLRHPRP